MLAPKTGDLPAHVFRAKLFGRDGFGVWNGNWYGGHHTPGYSLLFPPIAWLLGPAVAGALAALAATALFEPLARAHFGERARWGALWFGVGTACMLLNAQLPFVMGVAIGLGSLLALQRGRPIIAVVLALLCPLGSPVAGLFLALGALAWALATRRRAALAVAVAALLPPLLLALAFPEGGRQPYAFSAFIPVPVLAATMLIVLPRRERVLRWGVVLYALAALAAYLLPTAMGGNASRLGVVFAGPLAACVLLGAERPRLRPWIVAVLLIPLAYWQFGPAVRNVSSEQDDASRFSAYYHPLLEFLDSHESPPGRVEVVFTHSQWEAATVAIHEPLARGWERQLDVSRNSLFYKKARPRRGHLRAVAGRERGRLRGATRRDARLQRQAGGPDRGGGPAVPAARLALPALAGIRGHEPASAGGAGGARRDRGPHAGDHARAAAGQAARQRDRAGALDAVLGGRRRLRGARRRLDTRDHESHGVRCCCASHFSLDRMFEHGRRCA